MENSDLIEVARVKENYILTATTLSIACDVVEEFPFSEEVASDFGLNLLSATVKWTEKYCAKFGAWVRI